MSDNEYNISEPFVLRSDGIMSDRELWAHDMNPEHEAAFDEYLYRKALGEAAEKELARREELAKKELQDKLELEIELLMKERISIKIIKKKRKRKRF